MDSFREVYRFEVTGIVRDGNVRVRQLYVYISLDKAQEFAALGDGVTGIEVKTVDRWQAATSPRESSDALGWPYRTVDWQEQNHSLFQALKLEKLGMGVILLLIVMVAAFNIVSTLTMVVADKTRRSEFSRRWACRRKSIRRIFLRAGNGHRRWWERCSDWCSDLAAALALDKYKFIQLDPPMYFIDHLPVCDAAGGRDVDRAREHRHRRDRDRVSVNSGIATVSDRGDQARMTMTVLEAHDVYKTYIGGDGSVLNVLERRESRRPARRDDRDRRCQRRGQEHTAARARRARQADARIRRDRRRARSRTATRPSWASSGTARLASCSSFTTCCASSRRSRT